MRRLTRILLAGLAIGAVVHVTDGNPAEAITRELRSGELGALREEVEDTLTAIRAKLAESELVPGDVFAAPESASLHPVPPPPA